MAKHNLSKSTAAIFAILYIFSIAEVALAKSTPKFLDSSHPLAKAVALVSQNANSPAGNGIVVGSGGCYVLTNFHVAFGKSKDPKTGRIEFVDEIRVGHKVLVNLDFDSKAGRFKTAMRGEVVEFGNFEQDTRRGKTEDYALLKLETCVGPGYGLTAFEHDAEGKRYPEGKISTVAFRELNGKLGIVIQEECPSFEGAAGNPAAQAPITGTIATMCDLPPGTSGSMLLATDIAGVTRLVGVNQGGDWFSGGTKVSVSVYARKFNKVLASVLGEGPFTSSNVAGDRRPQTEQTAMAPAGRTVVR